jgi:hypothetical protein
MNDDTSQSRRGLPRRAALWAAAAGLALLTAACSSSPPPRPSPGAYSACLRKHGVTGAFAAPPPTSLPTSSSQKPVAIPGKDSAAMRACRPLVPQPKSSGLQVP